MDLNALTQKEAARLLGLTSRQVRNLVEKGMPRDATGQGDPVYRWADIQPWYLAFKQDQARAEVAPNDIRALELREKAAKVRIAEMEAAEKEGSLLPVAVVERVWADVMERLRSRIVAHKGGLAPRMTGLPTPQDALEVLDPAFTELLAELRASVDDWDDDEVDDAA